MKIYIKNSSTDLKSNFSAKEIDRLRHQLHNVLWGGGKITDEDIFSSLVNIVLAKIEDEHETQNGEKYQFQCFQGEDDKTLFQRVNALYKNAIKKMLGISTQEIKKYDVIDEKKFSLDNLKFSVENLQPYAFLLYHKTNNSKKDILGDFFERIIRENFKQSKGQFFTHTNIINFLLWGLKIDQLAVSQINDSAILPYLIDPSSGMGTFLIEYMKFITQNMKRDKYSGEIKKNKVTQEAFNRWFLKNRNNQWASEYVHSKEIHFNLVMAAKVNMILHGAQPDHFLHTDTLLSKIGEGENKKFDIILSNPPFSVKGSPENKEKIKNQSIFESKNSENLFIEIYYHLLKPNGRLGVILPESVFDTAGNKYIRLFIYKFFKIKAIISLPKHTFEPFTSTKTSLLLAQKKTKEEICIWERHWEESTLEWESLKNNLEEKQNTSKEVVEKILKKKFEKQDQDCSYEKWIEKYQYVLDEFRISENIPTFGKVNMQWVFQSVAQKLNYTFFIAEAHHIGYKKSERGEKETTNDLFRMDEKGNIFVDDGIKTTILDHLRQEVHWDSY